MERYKLREGGIAEHYFTGNQLLQWIKGISGTVEN